MDIKVIATVIADTIHTAAVKVKNGKVEVLVDDVEKLDSSSTTTHYGYVNDGAEIAYKLDCSLDALKNRLNNNLDKNCTINRCYFIMWPFSCSSEIITETRTSAVKSTITRALLLGMEQTAKASIGDDYTITQQSVDSYVVDGKVIANPIGMVYNNLEVNYLITKVHNNVLQSAETIGNAIAGKTIEPLIVPCGIKTLADEDECVIFSIEDETATAALVKNQQISKLRILPFGTNAIKKDISTALQIAPSLANETFENKLRLDYDNIDKTNIMRYTSTQKVYDVNYQHLVKVIYARLYEIISCCKSAISEDDQPLPSTLVLSGSLAAHKSVDKIKEFIKTEFEFENVRTATLANILEGGESSLYTSPLLTSLFVPALNATENCVDIKEPVAEPVKQEVPETGKVENRKTHSKKWKLNLFGEDDD